jgi:hypothetical protein
MIQNVHPGSDPRSGSLLFRYPSRIPDPGVKKAPGLGSGSATLVSSQPTGHFEHVERRHTFPLRLYNVVTDVLFSAKFVKQGVFNVVTISILKSVLRIRIQDPQSRIWCLFDTWIWDLGSGMGKKPGSGIWIRGEQPGSYCIS